MRKIKKIAKTLFIFGFASLVANCTNEEIGGNQPIAQEGKISKAKSWFTQYESNGYNYDLFQNLVYDWNEASITKSEDGTETIIVPVIELKKDEKEIWEQKLYLYKLGTDSFKALLFETYSNKNIEVSSQTIEGGDFTGYMTAWDIKTGFVRAAKFINNQVVEIGDAEFSTSKSLTSKAPSEAPCVYSGGDGGCDKGGGKAIELREVVITGPSTGSPVVYIPRDAVTGGTSTGGFTSPGAGGSSGGGATSINSTADLVALINSTDSLGYNITFDQNQNTVTSAIQINVIPWAGVQIFINQNKIANKFIVQNVTTNMTGLTVGFSWSQTNYSQTTSGTTTSVTLNGVWSYNLYAEGIGTVYTSPITYKITVNNTTGRIIDGKKL